MKNAALVNNELLNRAVLASVSADSRVNFCVGLAFEVAGLRRLPASSVGYLSDIKHRYTQLKRERARARRATR